MLGLVLLETTQPEDLTESLLRISPSVSVVQIMCGSGCQNCAFNRVLHESHDDITETRV